jgi:NADPH:quinone reductase-like Zn-dependent oxidoreductase
MIAARFTELGIAQEVLKIEDIPVPEPQAGEVLIKVSTSNINPSDIMYTRGLYGIQPELPASGGFEAAGIVEQAGADTHLSTGTKVVFAHTGVWQEYVVVSEKAVIPIPNEVPDELACQLFVNPLTAYGMLEVSGIQDKQFLVLTAGASAFSKFVIQLCREKGILPIATVRHEEQKQKLLELGCHAVINTGTESVTREIIAQTHGKGAECAFDAVGGELGMKVLNGLAAGGTMYVYGLLSLKNIPLNSGVLIFKNLTVKGFWLTTWFSSLDANTRATAIKFLIGRFMKGEMEAPVEAVYPLKDIRSALDHFEKPGREGKILLKP